MIMKLFVNLVFQDIHYKEVYVYRIAQVAVYYVYMKMDIINV